MIATKLIHLIISKLIKDTEGVSDRTSLPRRFITNYVILSELKTLTSITTSSIWYCRRQFTHLNMPLGKGFKCHTIKILYSRGNWLEKGH